MWKTIAWMFIVFLYTKIIWNLGREYHKICDNPHTWNKEHTLIIRNVSNDNIADFV
jgi:hypothetical protein